MTIMSCDHRLTFQRFLLTNIYTTMPFLISLEANIDNSGLGQIRPCWLFSFLIFYVDKRQLTKTRLIPVCTENLTLILNFIKKSI